MKDIPIFDTENGVASLFLQEIPYRRRAHIKIRSSVSPEDFLEECVSFCRACGAEWIDASGHDYLKKYPLITALYRMSCTRSAIPQTEAFLFPMTEDTMEQWVQIYNDRMADIPNCAWLDKGQAEKMLSEGNCYFIHQNGELLGIGSASDGMIHTVVAVKPGMGETVVRALVSLLETDVVSLQVASENPRARRLYERMGFVVTKEIACWYRVF